jgi:hypothetical protein
VDGEVSDEEAQNETDASIAMEDVDLDETAQEENGTCIHRSWYSIRRSSIKKFQRTKKTSNLPSLTTLN